MMNTANEQQRRFVDEFLKMRKKNQTQAAIIAGYSPKSAAAQSSQLLKKPKVVEYMKEREKEMEQAFREEFFFDALDARKVLSRIMNDEEAAHKDQIAAAKDLLDRAGYKPIDKTELSGEMRVENNAFAELTTEELRSIARAANK